MSATTSPASILIVDDTAENLRVLSGLLGEQGFRVRPVTRGALAIRAAESDPPDLILLDINMPDMDGYEVCRQIKASEALAGIPVIFLTALTETADKVKAFTAGGVDYITKPFQFEEVLARVHTHLALRRARLELEEKHRRLLELEKLRDDLVHMVVHDFRSPLTVLCGNLDFIAADTSLSEQTASDLRTAMAAAQAVARMSNDLLDVSRLEEGKMPLSRAECDVVQIARDVSTALASMDRTRTFEVVADGPVMAECDRGILYRVAENIVNNAIKHTPAGSRIQVSVSELPSRIRIAIADEGPGIPAEARARIFEKFGTVANRQNRKYHSTGLGLAFCRLAVEAHGGTIGVDDGHPRGSVFWFEVPTRPSA